MDTPEGKGIARRAWEEYSDTITGPAIDPMARRVAAPLAVDLVGFWVVWHVEGGFQGLRRLGMSRASIYRRIKAFRAAYGVHPDEFEMPGVTLDVAAYLKHS